MTRIFTDGAEMYDMIFFSATTGGSVSNTVYASGGYSYYNLVGAYKTIAPIAAMYFKERVRVAQFDTTKKIIAFRSGATTLAYVSTDAVNRWVVGVGSSTVATSLVVASINTWYCMEVYYKADNVTGVLTLKIDGNTVCTFSGDTLPGADTTVDNVYWNRGNSGDWWIDDLALNDTAGGADDTWIGGGRITKITPNGNGAANEWTGSDADAVDNYLLVDEYPLDSDTTYVYEDVTATGDLDQYTMTDTYSGTNRTIQRIWAECRARKTSVAAAVLNIGFDTGASVNTDDVGTLMETYTIRNVGAEYLLNPDDAAAWEEADIDALEFVAEVG